MRRRIYSVLVAVGVLAAMLVLVPPVPPAAAQERPVFQLPFRCGETWFMSSYEGHGSAIDFHATSTGDTSDGKPVLASHRGIVEVRDSGDVGYGYYVVVRAGDYSSVYAHLVRGSAAGLNGRTVPMGFRLGTVGNTGKSAGRHLHYEQRRFDQNIPVVFNGTPVQDTLPTFSEGRPITSNNCLYQDGLLVRRADGVAWVLVNGMRRHIPDYPTDLCAQYFQKRAVAQWTDEQLVQVDESSTKFACDLNGKVLRALDKPEPKPTYAYHDNKRHWIPDHQTYLYLLAHGYKAVQVPTEAKILALADGGTEPRRLHAPSVENWILRRTDGLSWVVQGGLRYHIPDYPTDLCARWYPVARQVRTGLVDSQVSSIPESPATFLCDLNGKILRAMDKPDPKPAYAYHDNKRYWIADKWTYDYLLRHGLVRVDVGGEAAIKRLVDGGTESAKIDPAAIPVNSIIRRADGVSWVVDDSRVRHHIPFVQDDVCWRNLRGLTVSAANLTYSQANAFPEQSAWPCIIGDRVVKSDDGSSHFVDTSNIRHAIPDVETFWALSRGYQVVGPWPAGDVNKLPPGDPHRQMLDPEGVKNSIVCHANGVCWAVDGNAIRHHIPTYADNVCWRWVNGWRVSRSGVNDAQASSLREEGAWGCNMNGRIVATNEGAAYYMEGNTRRWIQDGHDFNCYAAGRHVIRGMSMTEAAPIPEGNWMPMCFGPGYRLVSIYSNANGRFTTAELGYGGADHGMLRARATSVGGWEQFRLVGDCNQSCGIQSVANRRFVAAELGYQGYAWGELRAVREAIGGWEQFRLAGDCATGCGILALGNGRYVSAELDYTGAGYAMLRARATAISGWERFRIR